MKKLFTLSALLFAACGDDNAAKPDAGTPDAIDIDAAIDAPPYVAPTPAAIVISAMGPDQLMSLAPGPSGTFYAAGYAAETPTGDKFLIVAKLTATGALDTTFASPNGFYKSTLVFKGGSDEIDIAVQSDGKIVVAGTIANDTNAADKDIGLFRVDATGALDTTFGTTLGTSRVNLSTAFDDNGTLKALDSQRGLAVGPSDTLFIHAASRNDIDLAGAREDTDFTVARLTALGVLDPTYGVTASTPGKYLLDLTETDGIATPKGLHVLADGSVIGSGYAKTATSNGTPQPVLYRLVPGGATLDTNFATGGLFHEIVLTLQTEIYNFAVDNNNITTAGYGRESGTANVWASLRFNTTTGARDTAFGGITGVVTVDPSGALVGANCRNAVGLPGGGTALIGSAGGTGARDAAVVFITKQGALDTAFGDGIHTFDLAAGTEDQWWGGAVSGGKLLIVGWRGVGATQTDTANDNSFGVLFDL